MVLRVVLHVTMWFVLGLIEHLPKSKEVLGTPKPVWYITLSLCAWLTWRWQQHILSLCIVVCVLEEADTVSCLQKCLVDSAVVLSPSTVRQLHRDDVLPKEMLPPKKSHWSAQLTSYSQECFVLWWLFGVIPQTFLCSPFPVLHPRPSLWECHRRVSPEAVPERRDLRCGQQHAWWLHLPVSPGKHHVLTLPCLPQPQSPLPLSHCFTASEDWTLFNHIPWFTFLAGKRKASRCPRRVMLPVATPNKVWSLSITAGFFVLNLPLNYNGVFLQTCVFCTCCKIPLVCGSSRLFSRLNRWLWFPSLSMRLGREIPASERRGSYRGERICTWHLASSPQGIEE